MKSNFHTHTYRCRHAGGTEADYAAEAFENGLDILGFSDHAPFKDVDYGCRMDFDELPEYIAAVQMERERYIGKMSIFTGLEIEYLPKYSDYYEYLLNDLKLDYLALGEHFFSHNGDILNIFSSESTDTFVLYAHAIADALKTGYFTFLAHPDIMFLNYFAWDKNCDRACSIIVDAAAQNNIPVEFNANGIRRGRQEYPDGKRFPYPHPKFWSMAKEAGLKVIVGSDCHGPSQIYDKYMQRAVRNACNLGLNVITEI